MFHSRFLYSLFFSIILANIVVIIPAKSEVNRKIYPGTACTSPNDKVDNFAFLDNGIRNITKNAFDEGDDQIGYVSVNCPIVRDAIFKDVSYARVTVSAGSEDLELGTLYCRFIAVSTNTKWAFHSDRTVNSFYDGGAIGAGIHNLIFGKIPNQSRASYMIRCDLPPTLPGKSSPTVYSYQVNEL